MIRHLIRRWIRIDHVKRLGREKVWGSKIHVTVMQAEGTKRMWLEKTGERYSRTGIGRNLLAVFKILGIQYITLKAIGGFFKPRIM